MNSVKAMALPPSRASQKPRERYRGIRVLYPLPPQKVEPGLPEEPRKQAQRQSDHVAVLAAYLRDERPGQPLDAVRPRLVGPFPGRDVRLDLSLLEAEEGDIGRRGGHANAGLPAGLAAPTGSPSPADAAKRHPRDDLVRLARQGRDHGAGLGARRRLAHHPPGEESPGCRYPARKPPQGGRAGRAAWRTFARAFAAARATAVSPPIASSASVATTSYGTPMSLRSE